MDGLEYIVGLLGIFITIITFIPVTKKVKVSRIKRQGYQYITVTSSSLYRIHFYAKDKNFNRRLRHKAFVCFGYCDIKEI